MGHLVDAIKKLDQQREPVRPKPARRNPAAAPETKTWRFDEAHRGRIGEAHGGRIGEPQASGAAPRATDLSRAATEPAVEIPPTAELPKVAAPLAATEAISRPSSDLPRTTAPPPTIAKAVETLPPAGTHGSSVPKVGWQFAAPTIPQEYHGLAARLLGQVVNAQKPQLLLLTAVSSAALDAVSLAALAAVFSAQGNVLWVDTRNRQPTPTATGPTPAQYPGWHELRARKATWDEIIAPTSMPGVSFVGCGERGLATHKPDLGEHLFAPLGSAFSLVLIDGGLVGESSLLSPHCDVTGLVVAIGQTTHDQVETALGILGTVGGKTPLAIAVEPHRSQRTV